MEGLGAQTRKSFPNKKEHLPTQEVGSKPPKSLFVKGHLRPKKAKTHSSPTQKPRLPNASSYQRGGNHSKINGKGVGLPPNCPPEVGIRPIPHKHLKNCKEKGKPDEKAFQGFLAHTLSPLART